MRASRIVSLLIFCLIVSCATLRGQTKPPASPTVSPAPAASAPAPASTASTPVPAAAVANPTTPAEFFARARQLSDLEAAGIPFHLKATFVAVGGMKSPERGTIEMWWQGKNHWRKVATFGNFDYVAFKNGAEDAKVYTSAPYVPWHVTEVLGCVLILVPNDASSGHWKLKHKKIKHLEYTLLSQKNQQYLFAKEGILRIVTQPGMQIIYNNFRSFQKVAVPFTIVVGHGGKQGLLTISIHSIATLPLGQQTASLIDTIPHDLQPLGVPTSATMPIGGPVSPPILIHHVDAGFPESARQQHTSADYRVVVQAIVDEQGMVEEAHILQSAGSDFDNAALSAVRQYRFKPAMFKGYPVPVKLSIIVEFHIRGW